MGLAPPDDDVVAAIAQDNWEEDATAIQGEDDDGKVGLSGLMLLPSSPVGSKLSRLRTLPLCCLEGCCWQGGRIVMGPSAVLGGDGKVCSSDPLCNAWGIATAGSTVVMRSTAAVFAEYMGLPLPTVLGCSQHACEYRWQIQPSFRPLRSRRRP